MKRGQISNLVRKAGLIYATDWLRYYVESFRNRRINRSFRKNNPEVKLPPDYLIYEAFALNYRKYYTDSIDTAQWLVNHLAKHTEIRNKIILDWGCGPGRIIRHLPVVAGNGCEYYGTDYNASSINWCSENIPGIHFNNNTLEAKLPYSENFFDIIYGISIFTHLSEQMHRDWYAELLRILKPGGIMLLTTQGKNFEIKLTENELEQYQQGKLIVRGNVKEGHRTFSAFHPQAFIHQLFSGAVILEHLVPLPEKNKGLPQDIWIIQKN